jgi:hypothetical protein
MVPSGMASPSPNRLSGALLALSVLPLFGLAYGGIALQHARSGSVEQASRVAMGACEFLVYLHAGTLAALVALAVLVFSLGHRTAKSGKSSA